MKGKIYLIKKGLGRVIFDDFESNILDLPKSFENEDIVEVDFINNDRNMPIRRMVAYSKDFFYGYILKYPIILATYPLRGTILSNNINSFRSGERVSFRLKKIGEEISAIDIKETKSYKAKMPFFGKLKKSILHPKDGVIKEIIKDTKPKNAINGRVKVLNERGFGFVSGEEGRDYFFMIKEFEKAYGTHPKKGDIVYFTYKKTSKGTQINNFYVEKKLPIEKQYGFIDDYRFDVKDFISYYQREPIEGDIVSFVLENKKVIFTQKDIKSVIFEIPQKGLEGEVKFVKNDFGFIKTKEKDIFFLVSKYENFYKKKPKKGDRVFVSFVESLKGFQVKDFFPCDSLKASKKVFKNFFFLENALYYAYIDNNKVKEIKKYNPNDLSESITCYKSKVDLEYKLQAIDSLLEQKYQSKNITRNGLFSEKKEILKKLIEKNRNNYSKALYYETKLQQITFDRDRLKSFKTKRRFEILLNKRVNIKLPTEKIAFYPLPKEIQKIKLHSKRFELLPKIEKIQPVKILEKKWDIRLKENL